MKTNTPTLVVQFTAIKKESKFKIYLMLVILKMLTYQAYAQVPTISSFSPLSGQQHILDTITGTNFHTNPDSNFVFFGGLRANVIAASPTELVAEVPTGATSDFICVTKGNLTAISNRIFQIAFAGGNYLDTSVLKYTNMVNTEPTSSIKINQVASGDFNGDKAIDLAVVRNNTGSRVYINNKTYAVSNTSFQSYISLNDNTGLKLLKQFDINSDGKPDIISINKTLRKLYIFRNISIDSVLAFSSPDTLSLYHSPADFDINDYNQDGKIDLAITFDTTISGGSGTIILRNISTSPNVLVFAAPEAVSSFTGKRIRSGDLNLDNKIDLIVLRNNLTIEHLLMNNSTSTAINFTSTYTSTFNQYYDDIEIGDINKDGKPDLLMVAGNEVFVYVNHTTAPTFTYFSQSSSSYLGYNSYGYSTKISDINGDGFPDIVSCNTLNNYTRLVLNNKTANPFNPFLTISIPGNLLFKSHVSADLDTNNAPDIITFNNGMMIIKNDYIKTEPTILSSAAEIINRNGHTIKFKVTPGNGNQRIVVVRKGLPLVMKPIDYVFYSAMDTFGRGSQLEPNSFVVYKGQKDTFEVKGLERNTRYYFGVFELNGKDSGSNYSNTGYTFDINTTFEVSRQLSNIVVSNVTDSSVRISWTKGDGHKRLVVMQREGTYNISSPTQNKYYKAGIYGKGDTVKTYQYYPSPDTSFARWFTVYADTGSFCDLNGLTSGGNYTFRAYEYVDTLNAPYYFYDKVFQNNFTTISYAPRIDSIVPLWAKPGDKITVYGNYFDIDPNKNRTNYKITGNKDLTMAVTFGVVKAEKINIINKKIIETTVPYGATNDFIRVTAYQRGDAYSSKKFQPYFLSRDVFGTNTINTFWGTSFGSSGFSFSGFVGADGSNDGIPDYYMAPLKYFNNAYYQYSNIIGTNPPNCGYISFESNIDYNFDLSMDVLYSCEDGTRIITTNRYDAYYFNPNLPVGPTLCNNDFNRDGKFDRLIYYGGAYQQAVVIFNNQPIALPFGSSCRAGIIADLNNDNKVDIIAANYNTGKIKVLRNIYDTGAFTIGSFAPLIELSNLPGIEWIECADLDQDGREDFAISNSLNNTLSIYKNISTTQVLDSNSFILKAVFTLPAKPGRFKFQDISGDGKIDISIAGNAPTNGRMTMLINKMNNGVIDTSKFMMYVTSPNAFQGDFKLIDQNLDGKPEIFTGVASYPGFDVYSNNMKLFNINKLSQNIYKPGDSLKVSYNTFGRTFNSGNVSKVQLLNSAGNTVINTNLGQKTTIAAADTINIFIPLNTPDGLYRFRILATNPADTSVTADFTITVCGTYNKPVITSNKGFNICKYDSAQFDLTNKITGTFNWYRNDTLVASNNSATTYFNKPGLYHAELISSIGCLRISNDTALNHFSNSLSGTSLSRSATFCKGDSTEITINSTHSAFKTQWYKNSLALPADTFASLRVKNSGIYRAVIIDTNLCSVSSNPISINANEFNVKLQLIGNSRICQGDSALLRADSNGFGGLKYQWLKNNIMLSDTTKALTIKTPGVYKLRATNTNFCSEYSQDTMLYVMDLPVPTISSNKNPGSICYYDSITLTTQSAFLNYTWYKNASPISNNSNYNLIVKNPGAYKVKVIDSNGCTNLSYDTIITFVNKRSPQLQLSKANNLCSEDSLNAFVKANIAYKNFQWFRNNIPLAKDTSILLVVNQPGIYSINIIDTSLCIHKSNDTLINQLATPQVALQLNGSNQFCSGDSVKINVISNDTISSYQWKHNEVTVPSSLPYYYAKQSGRFAITITSNKGCKSLPADTLIIVKSLPTITLNTINHSNLCDGDSLYLLAGTNTSPAIFKWKRNGIITNGATDSTLLIKQSGIYSVSVMDQHNCNSLTEQTTIQFHPLPLVVIQNIKPLQFCYNDSSIFYFNSISSNKYQWYRNDTLLSDTGNFITIKNTGRYFVSVSDTNTCSNKSNNLDAQSYPQPMAPMINMQNDTLFSSAITGNQWIRNDTLIAGANLPFYVPQAIGAYKVQYTNINGCLSQKSEPYVFISTGINPLIVGNLNFPLISPNPFQNKFTIHFPINAISGFWNVAVYNSIGQLILNNQALSSGSIIEVDMATQTPGVYYVVLSSAHFSKSYKLIKSESK